MYPYDTSKRTIYICRGVLQLFYISSQPSKLWEYRAIYYIMRTTLLLKRAIRNWLHLQRYVRDYASHFICVRHNTYVFSRNWRQCCSALSRFDTTEIQFPWEQKKKKILNAKCAPGFGKKGGGRLQVVWHYRFLETTHVLVYRRYTPTNNLSFFLSEGKL
jgi:hypothetical protein